MTENRSAEQEAVLVFIPKILDQLVVLIISSVSRECVELLGDNAECSSELCVVVVELDAIGMIGCCKVVLVQMLEVKKMRKQFAEL